MKLRTMETVKRTASVNYLPGTFNEEERTVEFVLATDAQADFGSYFESLGMDDTEMRTKRLDDGIVPILDSHPQTQWKVQTIDDQFGRVMSWRKEDGKIIGTLVFAKDERSNRAFEKIRDGILRTGSIGYFVYKVRKISGPNDDKAIYRATDWEIVEFSLVSIPRDPDAQARNMKMETIQTEIENEFENLQERNSHMKKDEQNPNPQAPSTQELETARAASAQETTARILDIQAAVKAAGFAPELATDMVKRNLSLAEASKEIFKKMEERSAAAPEAPNPMSGLDVNHDAESDRRKGRIKAMSEAIMHRADEKFAVTEDARQFVGMRLIEMARKSLALQGMDTKFMNDESVIRAAFQPSSDFPEITGAAMNMSVKRGWDTVINNYEHLITHTDRSDFKEGGSVSLSDAPVLKKMNEQGKFETGLFTESAEKYEIETLGVEVGVTRKTLYNDQFGVFGKVPFSVGASGARTVKEMIWNVFISNQKMYSDNKDLFHADHKNLKAAVAALDSAALAALVLCLRKQTSPKGKIMNYNPGYLVVSAELEEAGRKLLAQIYPATSANANVFKDSLQGLIIEGTLGAKDFYLSGRKEEVDMIEVAWLNGNRGVQVMQKEVFGTGIKWEVLMDVGVAPLDYRGFAKGAIT